MGKRSNFKRNPRDYYPSPLSTVLPLLPHLDPETTFVEPCAGDGRLIRHLERFGHHCAWACDIEPQSAGIYKADALTAPLKRAQKIITNPVWSRPVLHAMIEVFRVQAPTWLLFDVDWASTVQARPYLKYCDKIVSVGRVSWMENGVSGKDNAAWFSFQAEPCVTEFVGRS